MNENSKLLQIPFHNSLNKPKLVMGGDRELMMMTALISLTMIFVALSWQSLILGVVIWFIFSTLIRWMAKADPQMRKIYIRQLKYQKFYLFKSTPFRKGL